MTRISAAWQHVTSQGAAMVHLTGAALGYFAFTVTIFLGISAGNSFETIIYRGIQAMFTFFAVGLAVGWVGNRVVDEHAVKENRELFPDESAEPDAPIEASAG